MASRHVLSVLAATAAAILVATSGTSAQSSDPALTGVTWLVERLKDAGEVDTGQSTFTVTGEGKVATTLGCNRMGGTATIDGEKITFGPLMSTRMACAPLLMKQEQIYADLLAKVRSYAFEDGMLVLKDESGTELVRFARGG